MTLPAYTEAATVKHIVLIAGPKSHGPGEHEYAKSAQLLAELLNRAPNLRDVAAKAYFDGWPQDPSILDHADTIAFFSDGEDRTGTNDFHSPFMTDERMRILGQQMKRGCGLVTFHFSVFAPSKYASQMLEWNGGYFDWQDGHGEGGFFGIKNDPPHEKWHSAIRVMETNVVPATPGHPILNGVSPFRIEEEFYYRLRFERGDARFAPILRVPALAAEPEQQIVGWAVQRVDGGRGFGTSMGHFFQNWSNEGFRRLILNALAWTAHIPVSKDGVESHLDKDELNRILATP